MTMVKSKLTIKIIAIMQYATILLRVPPTIFLVLNTGLGLEEMQSSINLILFLSVLDIYLYMARKEIETKE